MCQRRSLVVGQCEALSRLGNAGWLAYADKEHVLANGYALRLSRSGGQDRTVQRNFSCCIMNGRRVRVFAWAGKLGSGRGDGGHIGGMLELVVSMR